MGILQQLALLALRPTAAGVRAEAVSRGNAFAAGLLLQECFALLGLRLSTALNSAAQRAWQTVELASGDRSWLTKGQRLLDAPEDQALAETLGRVLAAGSAGVNSFSHLECLREMQAVRRSGALDEFLDEEELARQVLAAWPQVEPAGLQEAEQELIKGLAADLRGAGHPHTARLLEVQSQAGSTLLARALRYHFFRTVQQDEHLRGALPWAAEATVLNPDDAAPAELADIVEHHQERLDALLQGAAQRPGAGLQAELERVAGELQAVGLEASALLAAFPLARRELRAVDGLDLVDAPARAAIGKLLGRYRSVPQEQRRTAPALLQALAKLEYLAGEFAAAQQDFEAAAALAKEPGIQAEALASVCQLALERRLWPDASAALKRAAALDAERFALFPLSKYEPEGVVRHDAFGVIFSCKHRTSGTRVWVRTLRPELLDRTIGEIFRETQVVESLDQPALLRIRDCDFADAAQTRPYLVCDPFDGLTLTEHIEQVGPPGAGSLLSLMRPVALALRAAHARGLLHRDLRPGTLLVRKEGTGWRLKIINFGLALPRPIMQAALGNPAARQHSTVGLYAARIMEYAAPELCARLPGVLAGPQAEIYNFGKTCYYALLRTADPDDEEKEALPSGWRRLLSQCTATAVSRRPASFDAVLERLAPRRAAQAAAPSSPPVGVAPAQSAAGPGAAASGAEAEQAAALVQRGIALRLRGKFDQAIAEFTRASQLDPKNPLAYEGRGNALVNKGEFDRAIADYGHALRLDAKLPLVYINRGLAHVKKKDFDQAIADYSAAIQIDPKSALGFLNRGSAYARKAEYDRAIADYTAAVQLDPRLALAYFNRGLAHFKKGEFDQAIADYSRSLQLDPDNPATRARRREAEHARRQAQAVPAAPPVPAPPAAKASPSPVGQELHMFTGHTGAVRAVAFAPDGASILTGSEDKTLRTWETRGGKKLARFVGHEGGISSVAFAPDGGSILSGSQDRTVRLWDAETGQEQRRFGASRFLGSATAHSDAVVSVGFSPDGLRALSASSDKSIRLWDVETGKEIRAYEGHDGLIHSIAFSPDGRHFLYGSEDHTARLCEVESGQEIRRFEGHTSWVLSVAFAPDGKQVLTGSSDGTLRLWSVTRGKEIRRLGGQLGLVQSVAFAPDGSRALSGEYTLPGQDTTMRLWKLDTGDELAHFPGHQQLIWCVAFSPDGKLALTGSADQTARLWQVPK